MKEGGNASSIPLDIAVLSNMREFIKYSRLKQMALKVRPKLSLRSSVFGPQSDVFRMIPPSVYF